MSETVMTKCGLVAIAGAPNVGKSTLLNRLVGEKVGIVSSKANTTRVVVRGVVTKDTAQLIFVDTPGLNQSSKAFDRMLVQQAQGALADADVVMLVIDAARGFDDRARDVLRGAEASKRPVVLVLNKVDMVKPRSKLLPLMQEAGAMTFVRQVYAVDAAHGAGTDVIAAGVAKLLPEGPWLFPAGMATDMPLPLRLSELTREQVMTFLQQELPYGATVVPVEMGEGDGGKLVVKQDILVAEERHKGMVVGAGGAMLQRIGTAARMEMQKLLGRGVHLDLMVKVDAGWQERADILRGMGMLGD